MSLQPPSFLDSPPILASLIFLGKSLHLHLLRPRPAAQATVLPGRSLPGLGKAGDGALQLTGILQPLRGTRVFRSRKRWDDEPNGKVLRCLKSSKLVNIPSLLVKPHVLLVFVS